MIKPLQETTTYLLAVVLKVWKILAVILLICQATSVGNYNSITAGNSSDPGLFLPAPPITLYTYQSGSWNNIDVWTTDPGGTTLVGSKIPEDGDAIVVLPSRTLTLDNNIANSGLNITIEEGGILDNSGFQFTQVLSSLSGQGTLKLKSVSFPSSALNTFVNSGGGTVEYYYNDADHNLPVTQTTYNNLTINTPGRKAILAGNITINGNLKIQNGTLQINDETANRRTLIIYKDVTVNQGSTITVGAGNTTSTTDPLATGTGGTPPFLDYYTAQSHRVEIYGNFTNNGTVRFTNQPYPVFNAFPADGIASVFLRGASDNTLSCNGTTDFYNLIIDKGSDQTFTLTVSSSGYDKFRLFGANNAGEYAGENAGNPNLRKALWIRNGTLKLNGNVFIPTLVEGSASGSGDFYIPGNGALIIDGPDVVVMGTIDDYSVVNLAYGVSGGTGPVNGITTEPSVGPSSFSLYGKVQINDGNLYIGEIGRIIYYGTSTAEFIINGGIIDAKQFQSVSGGGKTAFWQTGGNLILRGRFKRSLLYTSLADMIASLGNRTQLNTARATSGGGNPLGTDPTVGTLNIDQDANVFHMEGGNISIYDVTGTTVPSRAIEVNSDPANTSVTGGNISIYITAGTVLGDANYGIASKSALYNLTVTRSSGTQSSSLLTIPSRSGVTVLASPPLMVLNNLILTDATLSANAVLNASNFDVKVGGNFDIQANAEYTPGDNRTVLNGSAAQTITNNGTITSGLYRFYIDKNSGTSTLGSNITVRDSLVILGGTLNDAGFTLSVGGNIYNAGIHTGNGKIQLNGGGTAYQTLSASVSGTPSIGNLEISSTTTNAIAAQLGSDFIINGLTMTSNKIFNIGSYILTIGSGGIASGSFSTARMIQTSGFASDGGLKMSVNAASLISGQTKLFPVGVSGNYTPATINGNTTPGNGTGFVTIIPVNSIHPAQNSSGQHLLYYWKSKASGMPSSSNVYYSFYNNVTPWGGNRAFVLLLGSTTWITGDASTGGSPNINLNAVQQGFISADITAGNPGAFNNTTAYYSIGSGVWNTNIWSNVSHTSASCGCQPNNASDVVYIGGAAGRNDSITLPPGTFNLASIVIEGSYTNDQRRPALNLQGNGSGLTVDIITGAGKLSSSSATLTSGVTDLGGLLNNDSALVHFYGTAYTLPALITSYPNLMITGGNTKILPSADVLVRKNLKITDNINPGNTLSLNGASGNLTVYGDAEFQNGGKLIVPVSATIRNINIYGDINFIFGNNTNANAIEASSGTGGIHKLNFYGNNIFSGASNLTFNPAGTNKIDLYIKDAGNTTITFGTGTFSLNKLYIQKDVITDMVYFKNNFTLNETENNSAAKSLNLNTGTLILSDPANGPASTINLNLSSGGTNYFIINSTSKLILRNGTRVNITGNNYGSGIRLDGLLQAEDASQINLADGSAAVTGYIEYTGSGNAAISLSGSAILKAAQIRRSLSLTTGLLNYSQNGNSATTIYGLGTSGIIDPSRAKFEVTGTGSVFNMSGTSSLTIINGGGITFGDLYLRPGSSSVTGGDIIFGTGVSGNSFKADAGITLNNLTINTTGAANSVQLMVNPLLLNGNLLLSNANSTLTTNNIDVTINGNFVNNGIYNSGLNTTHFSGSTQSISGTNSPAFGNLIISPTVKLSIGLDITVSGALNIVSGTLETTTHSVTVNGNITNNGIYTNSLSPAISRLYINGSSVQHIAGTGSFGRVELNNSLGARLDNSISLSEDLTLTNGILDINQYLLTLGSNSDITSSGFGLTNMIKLDGAISNMGIQKYFEGGFSGTFLYPLGVNGKYTPATLTVNATGQGFVRINCIDSRHPATIAPFNVLNYFWEAESNTPDFDGNLKFEYAAADVTGIESQYVAARLIIPPGTAWSKAAAGPGTDNVDETTHTISFDFPSGTNNLGGQYTAGYESDLPIAVPVYTSNVVSGDWETPESWLPVAPPGGPNGFTVIIKQGNTIYTGGNKRFAYKTTIDGTLDVGTTFGHNLGTVDGTGKIVLQQAILPAGRFTSFLSCTGGTLEYGGTTDYTIIADRIDTVRNLMFTGTGTRTLPDKDLVICNQLEINGPTLDNSVFNKKLTIGGTFDIISGSFISGAGPGATVLFKGTSAQTASGFNIAGASPLNNLEIDNPAGLTLNSNIEMYGDLLLSNGVISTSSTHKLMMINQSGITYVIPEGGSISSYVNGPMSKYLFGGNEFKFPAGKDTRYGRLTLINVQTGTWEAEYFNTPYSDLSPGGTLSQPSSTEYWRITSPSNGRTAKVQLRWDSQSDINPLTTSGGINDIRVAEFNGTDWVEKTSNAPIGNNTGGTVQTALNIPINSTGNPQFYTLGSVSTVKPTITLGTSPSVCSGTTTALLNYIATTGSPDQYTIDFDPAANAAGFTDVTAWTALPVSPISIIVPAGASPGSYNASISVRASGTPSNLSISYVFTIIINNSPAPIGGVLNICAGSSTVLTNAIPGGIWSSADPSVAIISAGGVVTGISAGTSVISYIYAGCSATALMTVTAMTWTGVVSTDWNTPGNWSCGLVPDSNTPVQITNVPNKPVLNSGPAATVSNLTIDPGATLTIAGNRISISGIITNNGLFNATDAIVEMNGPVAQTIGAGVFAGNQIKDLIINNTAGVSLLGPLGITGIVTAFSGDLSSGGNLTLLSTASQTSLIDGSGTGNVTGTVTMQRYLASGYGYKYFSSPFSAATVNEFSDESISAFYKFDENRFLYGNPVAGWTNYNVLSNILNPLEGYAINFGASLTSRTVDVSGVVNNGNLAITMSNHNNLYTQGFNLAGNPYPSPIDWDATSGWTKTNIDGGLYFYKTSTTDQYGGTYSSYVNYISSDGIVNGIIPSMQGFFVHVSNGAFPVNGTLGINNNVRITDLTHPFTKKKGPGSSVPLLRLSAAYSDDPASSDQAVIYFDEKAVSEYDGQLDALKMMNTDLNVTNLFTLTPSGTKLSVRALPLLTQDSCIIPLGLKLYRSGNGTIKIKISDIDQTLTDRRIYISDIVAGTEQDLLPDKVFSVSLDKGEYMNRFFLNFSSITTDIQDNPMNNDLFSIYSSQGLLKADISILSGGKGKLVIFNLTGQSVFIKEVFSTGYLEFNPGVKEGIYIVRYTTGEKGSSKKLFIQKP